MPAQDIRTEILEGVGWIVLDRPHVRNAARPQTMREVCEAIDRFTADPTVRAVALTGAGGHFLAGGDFDFLDDLTRSPALDARDEIYAYFQGAARRLFRCPKPTIAAVSGAAITVGCELCLACDIRIADETAFFQESWLQMGLIPPLGGTMLLPRYVGFAKAKEMILEARRVDANEALRIGLVNEVTTPSALRARAQERALAMAALPPAAFRAAKEAIHRGIESSLETEWQATVLAQGLLIGSEEFRSRVAERRRPKANKSSDKG